MNNSLLESLTNDNNLVIKKEEEYMEYIKNHISNVIKIFEDMVDNIDIFEDADRYDIADAIREVEYEGFIYRHDDSKYTDEEFTAYRRHFHSVDEKEKEESKEDFELAWKHHYTVNPHHPECWMGAKGPQPMPDKYIVEMACDWIAMCMTKGGTAIQYLIDNKEKKQKVMHPYTIKFLEDLLIIYYRNKRKE